MRSREVADSRRSAPDLLFRGLLLALLTSGAAAASAARADAGDVLFIADTPRRAELAAALRVELAPRVVRELTFVVDAPAATDARAASMRALMERERAGLLIWLEPAPSPLEPPVVHVVVGGEPGERTHRLAGALDVLEPRLFAIEAAALLEHGPTIPPLPVDAISAPPATRETSVAPRADSTDAAPVVPAQTPPKLVRSDRFLTTRYALRADVDAFGLLGRDGLTLGPAFALALGIAVTPWLEMDGRLADELLFVDGARHILDASAGVGVRLPVGGGTLRLSAHFGAALPLTVDAIPRVSAAIDAAWLAHVSSAFELGPRLSVGLLSGDPYVRGSAGDGVVGTLSLGLEARLRL